MLSGSSSSGTSPMCIYKEDYPKLLLDQLQILRVSSAIYDLDLSVQNSHFKVHKVVLAAASSFIKVIMCERAILESSTKDVYFIDVIAIDSIRLLLLLI